MNDRQKPIAYLKRYLGIKEGSGGHKEILAMFNHSGLCKRYKMTIYDAWCAAGVSAAFIATGLTDIFPCVECSCENMIHLAKKAGIWVEDDSYTPSIGDVILYDWDDSGKGDCAGRSDHVGLVAAVSGSTVTVIECNKNNTVGYRDIAVNSRYIRGYIAPKYKGAEVSTPTAGRKTVEAVAEEVLAGIWGNGDARKNTLSDAGYDYDAVQAVVNRLVKEEAALVKSVETVAKEVIRGKWGNGAERKRRLVAAGYDYDIIQNKVNALLKRS